MSRRVVVVADDHGISPAVSATIHRLLAEGRISGTGVMVVFDDAAEDVASLAALGRGQVGLHLTLTDHRPVSEVPELAPHGRLPGVGALWRRALTGRLDTEAVRRELTAQLDRFEAWTGRPPAYLDGHHHVQQIPGIAEVVVALAAERLGPGGWVRTCREDLSRIRQRGVAVGRAMAFSLAARGLHRGLLAAGVPTSPALTGVYGFDEAVPYGQRMARFLDRAVDGTVVMTHPGGVDAVLASRDGLTGPRRREADFLAGPAWPRLLQDRGLALA